MPFIRGRYHINPTMGAALEAARAAEELRGTGNEPDDQADGFVSPHAGAHASPGPIHRIEIEASEMVPSHSGRAERGFVARIHRHPATPATAASVGASAAADRAGTDAWHDANHASPETHVFTDHRDLVNFLHNELEK